MMTLDEAIKHCEDVSREENLSGGFQCSMEHKQLEMWLKELKEYRNKNVNK